MIEARVKSKAFGSKDKIQKRNCIEIALRIDTLRIRSHISGTYLLVLDQCDGAYQCVNCSLKALLWRS